MTTYKEIKGTQIEVVSSDPSNPVEGQVWYNSTDQAVKGQATTSVGAWATGNNMNDARHTLGGAGTTTAALAAGGRTPGNNRVKAETWNGTSWTSQGNMNNGKYGGGASGTVTAGLAFGGEPPGGGGADRDHTETFNGTNWTEVNELNTA